MLRLPQVAGRTPNPHTLLNYLYARIARGERFAIWQAARRNVIDVEHVVRIVHLLVGGGNGWAKARGETLAVANVRDYAMSEIVEAMERVTGKRAIYDLVARGGAYSVDTSRIRPLLGPAGVTFDDGYLDRVLRKYYGGTAVGCAAADNHVQPAGWR